MMSKTRARQSIPVIPRAPSKGLSAWQRARAVASNVVTRVVRVVKSLVTRAGTAITGAGRKIKARMARVARAIMVRRPWVMTRDGASYAARRAATWSKDTWRRVIHPFLRVRVVALGFATFVVGLAVAPVATIAITAASGVVLVGLARAISTLETLGHPAARVMLMVIEWVAQAGRVLAYVATAAVIMGFCFASVAFAATEVLELVLRYARIPYAVSIAALAFFTLTGNWALLCVEIAWLALTRRPAMSDASRERRAIPLIRIDAERAWNGNEVVDVVPGIPAPLMSNAEIADMTAVFSGVDKAAGVLGWNGKTLKCEGCDRDDGGPRFGIGKLASLCGGCFACLVDDELIAASDEGRVSADDVVAAVTAGVSVPGYVIIASGARLRSTRVAYDGEAITVRSPERVRSEEDPTRIYWAETAWWFDGRGERRARRWHGFVGGRIASVIEYLYARDERGFYVIEPAHGTRRGAAGPYRKLETAQEFAVDEIADLGIPKFLAWAESCAAPHVERDGLPPHMQGYAQEATS